MQLKVWDPESSKCFWSGYLRVGGGLAGARRTLLRADSEFSQRVLKVWWHQPWLSTCEALLT